MVRRPGGGAGAWTLGAGLLWALVCAAGTARAEDPLAPVVRAVRDGNDAGALATLSTLPEDVQRSARARFVRARLLDRTGRYGEAAAAYDFDARGLPARVAILMARRQAVARSRIGECTAARGPLLAWAASKEPWADGAEAMAAECAEAGAGSAVAIRELGAVLAKDAKDVDGFALRLTLADVYDRAGRRGDAVRTLRDAFIARAEHPNVNLAAERLAAFGEPLVLTEEERLQRAERLVSVREYEDALTELTALGKPQNKALWGRFYHLRGMSLYSLRRRYDDAAKDLGQAVRLKADTAAEDLFTQARALSRADENRAASALYKKFVKAYPNDKSALEAEYLSHWLVLREGDARGAAGLEKFATKYAKRGGDFVAEALFRAGFEALLRHQPKKAAPLFEKYAALGADAMVRGRGLYWLGVAKMEMHDAAGAEEALRSAKAVEPLHWYAMWAAKRLRELGVDPGPDLPPAMATAAAPVPADLLPDDVRFLFDLGFAADADDALVAQESAVRAKGAPGRGGEFAVRAYDAIGDHARASRMVQLGFADLLRTAPGPANDWAWRAAYPRPFADDVTAAAGRHKLPTEYLYAIMRQESGYDPVAVSYADAIGLLQLLPSTAARVGKGLGVTVTRDMLFQPFWNIEVSAAYSENLVARMQGIEPLAIASYNAGEERVERWKKEWAGLSLDRFVERIPVDQTRNYVRRVTSHYAHYKRADLGF